MVPCCFCACNCFLRSSIYGWVNSSRKWSNRDSCICTIVAGYIVKITNCDMYHFHYNKKYWYTKASSIKSNAYNHLHWCNRMLLAVDKPKGVTSYDVIRQLKKYFPKKTKIWHAWTLDPMATWLLLIGVWSWTKRLHSLTWQDKCYETTIDFSKDSDTRDMDFWKEFTEYELSDDQKSLLINQKEVKAPTSQMIQQKLASIIPSALLPLTPFSAKKVDGKKLYEYAREGNPIIMDCEMVVHEAKIIAYQFPNITLHLNVGKWTYIRSIGHWLWKQFWLGGTLSMLRRTSIASYHLNSYTMQTKEGLSFCIIDSDSDDQKLGNALLE